MAKALASASSCYYRGLSQIFSGITNGIARIAGASTGIINGVNRPGPIISPIPGYVVGPGGILYPVGSIVQPNGVILPPGAVVPGAVSGVVQPTLFQQPQPFQLGAQPGQGFQLQLPIFGANFRT